MMTMDSTEHDLQLNIHAVLPRSHANGPGVRAVVWVQGCRMRCPGCCNPLTHAHRPRILIEPARLARWVLDAPGIEGLTVSGGEPFEQAAAVGELCRRVRQGGLTVMIFTGWTRERIHASRDRAVKDLLDQIDLLVDGPYTQSETDPSLLWRGSRNQRVRFLTDRYDRRMLSAKMVPEVEVQLGGASPLAITGFPERGDLNALVDQRRRKAGMIVEPMGSGSEFSNVLNVHDASSRPRRRGQHGTPERGSTRRAVRFCP